MRFPDTSAPPQGHRLRGIMAAAAGFSLLTVGDAVVKTMVDEWPGTAIGALRYAIGALALGTILLLREGPEAFAMPHPGLQLARGITVGFSASCFFFGLIFLPLATATTITFTNPLFAALFSALFLRERMPRASAIASVVAMAGVILVLRPNFATAGFAVILPLLSAAGMAGLMILNRLAAGSASILAMQFYVSLTGAIVLVAIAVSGHLSGIAALHVAMPNGAVVARCALVALTATLAHTLIYTSTLRTPAAVVAPMIYLQLIVAIVLGWAVFGDRPDAMALGGAALVIASGLMLIRAQARG